MFSRRELLKYFGAGATIVPVLGGVPETQAPAKLIEEPRIQPVELATEIPVNPARLPPFLNNERCFITVDIARGNEHWRFHANTFITRAEVGFADLTSLSSPGNFKERLPLMPESLEWSMSGVCDGAAWVRTLVP